MTGLVQGTQTPRVSLSPAAVWNEAEDCIDLATQYGLTPDPWQANVLAAWMGRGADDRWAAGRWGIAVPRQNGKNGILEMVELYFMVILGLKILHTAHEVKTARKAFVRILSFFENERQYPELAAAVKSIRKTNGQEAIILHTEACPGGDACDCKGGGSVEFIARSKSSGRGFTVDVLVCDEAQEYGDDAQAALLPTISSAPSQDPLQILLGTPPGPGMDGTVFTRLREAGQAGAPRTAWCEWGSEQGVDVTDRAHWFADNPSLGIRLNLSTVEDEFGAMSPETFARERLGVWDNGANGSAAFNFTAWKALEGEPVTADAVTVFGVKFSPDGSTVALGAALKPAVGPVFVEGIASQPMASGTQWLVDWLIERKDRAAQVVIDGRAGVGYLVDALRVEGLGKRVILVPSTDQAITAHTMLDQAITEGALAHSGQALLDDQVRTATRRSIGRDGGYGWASRDPEGSVTVLDAVTLAHWGAKTTKRKPGRRQRFR